MLTNVWIPAQPASCSFAARNLAPASAVVSSVDAPHGERLLCYYEGNLYGAGNLVRFADRAHHASDRMISKYPTAAMGSFDAEELFFVGVFDTATGIVMVEPEQRAALCVWLNVTAEDLNVELQTTSSRHMALRALKTLDPITAQWLRRHGPSNYRDR
jgi:hypothetical protein